MKGQLKILLEGDVVFSSDKLSADEAIDRLIYELEAKAVQSAMKMNPSVSENISKRGLRALFEDANEEDISKKIDLPMFANDIAGHIKVYEKIVEIPGMLDLPQIIVNRARDIVKKKYGEKAAENFTSEIKKNPIASKVFGSAGGGSSEPVNAPLAVGAGGGGGGGA